MSALAAKDLQRALASVAEWHACRRPDELYLRVISTVADLVGGDRVTFEHLAPTVPEFWNLAEPGEPYEPWVWEVLLAHQHEHPVIAHVAATGEMRARKISDFVTPRAWHRTRLYQRLHGVLGNEDQMGISPCPPNGDYFAVVVNRGTWNSFTERDRELMTLLQPHLRRAHAHVRGLQRFRRLARLQEETGGWVGRTAIILNARGDVIHCPARARRWIGLYFEHACRGGRRLPEPVERWVRRASRRSLLDGVTPAASRPLVRRRDGKRLVLWLRVKEGKEWAILLAEQPAGAEPIRRALGLTPRQAEVLMAAAEGKTNDEIAAALSVSPHTVKKHLENIYETLGVAGRGEAVARMHQAL